ncbi:MAG TPA: zinc finger domain-containing protein [Candidatus Omnitrophota bacterium]|nr:zinc finger domain-containing protein [Candidatus Omnitrophota bacterium]
MTVDLPESADILQRNEKELARVFVVSQVSLDEAALAGVEATEIFSAVLQTKLKLKVIVAQADGLKCVRCWNYSTAVGQHPEHPQLCPKCIEALQSR